MVLPIGGLIDVHCHICDTAFDLDRNDVLTRAGKVGIVAMIAVGEVLDDAHKNLALAAKYPIIKPAAGLYPSHVDWKQAQEMADYIRLNREHLSSIGEVGLDFWIIKDEAQRDLQREIFKQFIDLSVELDLPLNVHSRSAGRHAIEMLLKNDVHRVQLHAFDGKAGAAQPAVEAGFFFSIPTSVVRSRQKQRLVRNLPLSCLLVETDSPVLGPIAQERNEPANLPIAIQTIAGLKNEPDEVVAAAVVENTTRLYGPLIQPDSSS